MRNLFNHPLGIAMPNGNLFKCAGEELMAGADIGSALLYGLFSSRNAAASNAQQHNSAMILNKKQYQYNSDLLKQADQYSAQQFAREAAYNTPKAQAQRLAEAGLNPYLLMQDHGAGISQAAGNTSSHSVGAPSTGSGGALPARMADVPNFRGAVDRLYQAADLKNKQYESFAKLADSIPSLVKGVGADTAKKVLSSAYGNIIDTGIIERQINAEVSRQEFEADIAKVKAFIENEFGVRDANQKWALGEQAISESFARIGKMSSDAKVNVQMIQKLASDVVRNVADAWKLRKEGEKFVADAKTVNALRQYVVSQARSRANMLNTSSFLSGSEPDTPVFDFVHSGQHQEKVVGRMKNMDYLNGDAVGFWVDRFFNDYVKVLGSPASHGGSSVTTTVYE